MKKKELGKGIRALLNSMDNDDAVPSFDTVKELSGGIAMISISEIEPNPTQPRTRFNEEQLQELAQSIKSYGIIQPLTLRKIARDKYRHNLPVLLKFHLMSDSLTIRNYLKWLWWRTSKEKI